MSQVFPTVSGADDAQRAGPVPLEAEEFHKVAGGIGMPMPMPEIIIIHPD